MIDFANVTELYVAGKEVRDLYINGGKVWEKSGPQPTIQGLVFTANTAGSTVKIKQTSSSAPALNLLYSSGGAWQTYTVGQTITLSNAGDYVAFKATPQGNISTSNTSMGSRRNQFEMTGSVACSGSIQYLLTENADVPTTALPDRCFYALFQNCTALTSAPDLPAPRMSVGCYSNLFDGCTNLQGSPFLAATQQVTNGCYQYIFQNCSKLNDVWVAFTNNFDPSWTTRAWLDGTASTGTLHYNGSDTSRGSGAIPNGWIVQTF